MRRGAVPPDPRYYEVFHVSASGARPALTARLRDLFATGMAPLTDALDRIYAEFIAREMPAAKLEEVSMEMSGAIADTEAALGSALGSVATYADTLAEASQRLSDGLNPDGLQQLTGVLQDRNSRMASEGEELRSRLSAANDRINILSRDLAAMRREAMVDPLTGVSNRRAFERRLAADIEEADSTGAPLVLMMADIDHFKQFNDRFGHQVGDQVLRLVAGSLAANVKGQDCVARVGGEEFAILLPRTAASDAVKLADVIRVAIQAKALVSRSTGQQLGRVTASFGVALHQPGRPGEELIAAADRCLYAAKANGRNCVIPAFGGEHMAGSGSGPR
jgi:diguanylate cyclase